MQAVRTFRIWLVVIFYQSINRIIIYFWWSWVMSRFLNPRPFRLSSLSLSSRFNSFGNDVRQSLISSNTLSCVIVKLNCVAFLVQKVFSFADSRDWVNLSYSWRNSTSNADGGFFRRLVSVGSWFALFF